LRLHRAAADESEPMSYDVVAYLLQALGRFDDADAVRRRRAETRGGHAPGRAAAARPAAAAGSGADSRAPPAAPADVPLEEAPALLTEQVAAHRVVIVNEHHINPEHRAFGARLVPLLRDAGITHLAVETGDQTRLDEAARTGRVTPSTDGFAFEPQRAALLRAALAARLPIVAFDVDEEDRAWMQAHPDEAFAYRERRMAEHIVERIFGREPGARLLVWVGLGHARKRSPPGLEMMAGHLWRLTGEEPFSAMQLTEGPQFLPHGVRISPVGFDVVIRHPEPSYQRGRPSWLRTADRRSVRGAVDPPAAHLLQLHLAAEGPAGTPVDQYLTGPDGLFELLVPPGSYLLRLWSPEERVVEERVLTVGGDVQNFRLHGSG
jgi:hypothetical protein